MPSISANTFRESSDIISKQETLKWFLFKSNMEQLNYGVNSSTTLLIERIFWICLGGFLVLAIITSLIKGLNENKNNSKPLSSKELKNLPKK